jgi:hypothetical protein
MVYYPVAEAEASALVTFLVGVLIGAVFTTVGAAGAATTGFYQALIGASTGIRPTNVLMTSIAPMMGVYVYWKERRIAPPFVGIIVVGIFFGVMLGSWGTVKMFGTTASKNYIGVLGVIGALTGIYLGYETLPEVRKKKEKLVAMSRRFEEKVKELRASGKWRELKESTYRTLKISPREYTFTFAGEMLTFNPVMVLSVGLIVGFIASFFGIGGGNLYVLFLAGVCGLPMYLVAGTSIAAALFTSLWTVINYLYRDVAVDWLLVINLALGVAIGGYLGPKYSKFVPEVVLRRFAGGVLLVVGILLMRKAGWW